MSAADQTQARLRDRYRRSAVDSPCRRRSPCRQGGGEVRKASSARGVVHGVVSAQIDQAHAQRIVAITNEGVRGLIALQACQTYVCEVSK